MKKTKHLIAVFCVIALSTKNANTQTTTSKVTPQTTVIETFNCSITKKDIAFAPEYFFYNTGYDTLHVHVVKNKAMQRFDVPPRGMHTLHLPLANDSSIALESLPGNHVVIKDANDK